MTRALRPLHALAHPLWWVAVIVLVVNDHLQKAALPDLGLLTGKLSDVAGLIVAPMLLAVLLRARSRSAVAACHLVTGAVFAAINVSALAAGWFEMATALSPWPWAIMVDPTDLLALPALLLSWQVLGAAARQDANAARQRFATASVLPAALACMATSPTEPPIDPPPPGFGSFEAELLIGNDTPREQVVRIRPLKETVRVDCDAARAATGFAFTRALFGPARSFIVQANGLVPVFGSPSSVEASVAGCRVFLVDGSDFDTRLLFWMANEFPTQFIQGNARTTGNDRIIRVTGDVRGEARWDDAHRAVHPPPGAAQSPEAACGLGGAKRTLDWTTPVPVGTWTITSTTSSPDGCHGLELERSGRWFLCLGDADLPFGVGDRVEIRSKSTGAAGKAVQGLALTSSTASVLVAKGDDLVEVDEGIALAGPEVAADCPRAHTACGGYAKPLSVSLTDGTDLMPGEEASIAGGVLWLLRAYELAVVDTECHEGRMPRERIIESVFVKNEG